MPIGQGGIYFEGADLAFAPSTGATVRSEGFMNTSWESSPEQRVRRVGNFLRQVALSGYLVEVLEPFHGRILDPACGSGDMFVQSARFVAEHKQTMIRKKILVPQPPRFRSMNLAIHGLDGDAREANTYYEDLHHLHRV